MLHPHRGRPLAALGNPAIALIRRSSIPISRGPLGNRCLVCRPDPRPASGPLRHFGPRGDVCMQESVKRRCVKRRCVKQWCVKQWCAVLSSGLPIKMHPDPTVPHQRRHTARAFRNGRSISRRPGRFRPNADGEGGARRPRIQHIGTLMAESQRRRSLVTRARKPMKHRRGSLLPADIKECRACFAILCEVSIIWNASYGHAR